ncbi:hypothetical protein MBLNU459_g6481t1 [Dothideomycetes sp. NU459]
MTGTSSFEPASGFHNDTAATYFEHSSAQRVNTDIVLVEALRREYPKLHLSIVPEGKCDLISFASAGNAALAPIDKETDRLSWRTYHEPARRLDGSKESLREIVLFGKFLLEWKAKEFVVYIADGRDGSGGYPQVTNQYVLSSSREATENLLLETGRWTTSLHKEVFVFDSGYWQKSSELYDSIKSAEWSNVILDAEMKKQLIDDVNNFFDGRETYQKLKVPWKRGAIYYGPPGNGKTISIKAMMHSLYKRELQVPTLYVKTLASYAGPEYALKLIFDQARKFAPCYLVFEDLDTIITAGVRSYFFNEVDGLRANDGIFMVGSTNHLDRLDPGIAKRPSRFDRKFYFPDPNEEQRAAYARFWQGKLKDNKELEFPDEMCNAIAKITDGFSFAYMQEAFVAALLALAAKDLNPDHADDTGHIFTSPVPPQVETTANSAPHTTVHDFLAVMDKTISPATFDVFETWTQEWAKQKKLTQRLVVDRNGRTIQVFGLSLLEAHELSQYPFVKSVNPLPKALDVETVFWRLSVDDKYGGIDDLPLWKEIKKQVKLLKDELDENRQSASVLS